MYKKRTEKKNGQGKCLNKDVVYKKYFIWVNKKELPNSWCLSYKSVSFAISQESILAAEVVHLIPTAEILVSAAARTSELNASD